MKIAIVGTGYVGLVTGACFAEMGNKVICVDIDQKKVDNLRKGIIPIYEPGLAPIVERNVEEGRLSFTTVLSEAMRDVQVIFIAVGTPPGEDGSADLKHVLAVASEIGANLEDYKLVVTKSTVPVGTAEKVRVAIKDALEKKGVEVDFDVASNPEFLKEGAAVEDFMKPDRIVVGTDSEKARDLMKELYGDFSKNHDRVFFMGIRDAEMTKYVANSMLATKISFMNEVANLCDMLGVDVENVRIGIGSDSRIGYSFIYPGCGYGGSCFPKDVRALIHTASQNDYDPILLNAVHERNERQKHVLFHKIIERFGKDLSGKTFAVWGLAFKPGTDDMREASSVVLIHELIGAGAKVVAYDPESMEVAKREIPKRFFEDGSAILVKHQDEALREADAMVLVTEWKPFRHPDFAEIKKLLRNPIIFDGRNQYNPSVLKDHGFEYYGIGRRA